MKRLISQIMLVTLLTYAVSGCRGGTAPSTPAPSPAAHTDVSPTATPLAAEPTTTQAPTPTEDEPQPTPRPTDTAIVPTPTPTKDEPQPTPRPTDTASVPTPTQTMLPPTATPPSELGEPVEVRLTAAETWVPANAPVVLRFGWATDTSEQVTDFLVSVELMIYLDGELMPDTGKYWSEAEESGDSDQDGDVDYQTLWLCPLGVLTPGTHLIESDFRLQWPVTDGFDSDGDGVLDQFSGRWESSLRIIVGQ